MRIILVVLLLLSASNSVFAQETKIFSDTETGKIWQLPLPATWVLKKVFSDADSAVYLIENKDVTEGKVRFAQFSLKRVKLPAIPSDSLGNPLFEEDKELFYLDWRRKLLLKRNSDPVLENLSFTIKKGEYLGNMINYEYQAVEASVLVRAHTYFLFGKKYGFEIHFEAEDEYWNELSEFFNESFQKMQVREP